MYILYVLLSGVIPERWHIYQWDTPLLPTRHSSANDISYIYGSRYIYH